MKFQKNNEPENYQSIANFRFSEESADQLVAHTTKAPAITTTKAPTTRKPTTKPTQKPTTKMTTTRKPITTKISTTRKTS